MSVMRTKSIEQSIARDRRAGVPAQEEAHRPRPDRLRHRASSSAPASSPSPGARPRSYAGPSIALSFVARRDLLRPRGALLRRVRLHRAGVAARPTRSPTPRLGELVAWIIGWDLLLELMLGASVVAQGWSQYAALFLDQIGITIPEAVAPGSALRPAGLPPRRRPHRPHRHRHQGVAAGQPRPRRASSSSSSCSSSSPGIAFITVGQLLALHPAGLVGRAGLGHHGRRSSRCSSGSSRRPSASSASSSGASIVFFAYIGFDVVATTAEEAKNPQRDLPIGIIASLVICTVLYVATTLVITGMVQVRPGSTPRPPWPRPSSRSASRATRRSSRPGPWPA